MMRARLFALATGSLVLAAPLSAQTDVNGGGSSVDANAMTGFLTSFGQLSGMDFSWVSDGTTYTGTWTCGVTTCSVSGTGFSLTASKYDQTYFSLWTLKGTDLSEIKIDAASADAVFDRTLPSPGTPGSSLGNDFNYCTVPFFGLCIGSANTPDSWNTTATYYNPVSVGGNPAVGDIWAGLVIDFGTDFNSTRGVKFQQDLDKVDLINDPGLPESTVTPEPATMSLMAMGLLGLAATRKRRRRA